MAMKLRTAASILAIALAMTAGTQTAGLKVLVAPFMTAAHAQDQAKNIDWQKVDDTLGRKAAVSGDVHRYGFPRSDLSVTLDGLTIKPGLALGGWVAFEPVPAGGAMLMGDLVLQDTEISPVMKKLLDDGLEVSAIHNHLLRTSIPVFYMHVG